MTAPSLLAPIVKIGGSPLDTNQYTGLEEVRVEQEFRLPARCTIKFTDIGFEMSTSADTLLGKEVTVVGESGPMFVGDVTGLAVEADGNRQPRLVVVAHDRAYKLTRSTTVATYLKRTYAQIASAIAQRHGLTAACDATTATMDYVLQADTDLGLLDAMADRIGYDWWVDGRTLNFKKPAEAARVEAKLGDNLESFSLRASGLHPDKVRVQGWDRGAQEAAVATTQSSAGALSTTSALAQKFKDPSGFLRAQAELVTSTLAARNNAEATAIATSLRDASVAAAVTGTGLMTGDGDVRPGAVVLIREAGPLNGDYRVTKSDHIYRTGSGFTTRFTAGDRRPNALVDTLSGGRRPEPFRHPGLVVGTVTNITDPDQVGRVKVKFPGLDQTLESEWARVLTLGGGPDRGLVVLPEVGDEVLVGFEGGDPRQPVVFGGLYGTRNAIPAHLIANGKLEARRLTSRTGHVVEVSDGTTPDKAHVLLSLKEGLPKLRIGKDRVDIEAAAGKPLLIKSGQGSIEINAQGEITIKGTKVTIEAVGSLGMKGATTVVEGTAKLDAKAPMVNVQAQGKGTIDGGGLLEVKGGLVKIN